MSSSTCVSLRNVCICPLTVALVPTKEYFNIWFRDGCFNISFRSSVISDSVCSGKWKLPIIISIGVGNDRFTDIQESIPGITPKVLAKELKMLEQYQLIKRIIIDSYPIKISYTLEKYANTLTPLIYSLKDWGVNHRNRLFQNQESLMLWY
jgi:DNA-binding HxlR family transcriptional regulator